MFLEYNNYIYGHFQANRRDILEIFEVSKQFLYFVAELRRYLIHCQKLRIII